MELEDDIDIFLFEDELEIEEEIDMQLRIIERFYELYEEEVNTEQVSNEELTRFNKLCDDQGFDYNEIKKFEYWLGTPTCEQWSRYFDIKHKYDKVMKTPEYEKLYFDKVKKNLEYLHASTDVLEIKQEDDLKLKKYDMASEKFSQALEEGNLDGAGRILDYINENYDEDYIPITEIVGFKGGTSDEISDLIVKLKEKIRHSIRIAITTIVIAIGIFLLFMNDSEGFAICISALLFSTGLYKLLMSLSLRRNKRILQNAFNEHQEALTARKDKRDGIINNEKRLLNELNEIKEQMAKLKKFQEDKFSETSEEFAKLKKEKDYYEQCLLSGQTNFNIIEFDDFRKNHFNDNAERLLRKLGIKGISKMLRNEAVQEGSEEDYRRFIEDKILNMDDSYFEDYREYYKNTFLKNNSH